MTNIKEDYVNSYLEIYSIEASRGLKEQISVTMSFRIAQPLYLVPKSILYSIQWSSSSLDEVLCPLIMFELIAKIEILSDRQKFQPDFVG